jgi:hypothetical protein
VLTLMFTLDTLEQSGLLLGWRNTSGRANFRTFLYAKPWRESVDHLAGRRAGGLDSPASPRGRVLGLVNQFVSNDPKATLVTPRGNGMDPPFVRMHPPHSVVVEMRTTATRSFGFFARQNTYVALFLDETTRLKRPDGSPDRAQYDAYATRVEAFLNRLTQTDIDRTTAINALITDDIPG